MHHVIFYYLRRHGLGQEVWGMAVPHKLKLLHQEEKFVLK